MNYDHLLFMQRKNRIHVLLQIGAVPDHVLLAVHVLVRLPLVCSYPTSQVYSISML